MQDLVIDNMEFENGDYFDVAYNSTFPITIVPGAAGTIRPITHAKEKIDINSP